MGLPMWQGPLQDIENVPPKVKAALIRLLVTVFAVMNKTRDIQEGRVASNDVAKFRVQIDELESDLRYLFTVAEAKQWHDQEEVQRVIKEYAELRCWPELQTRVEYLLNVSKTVPGVVVTRHGSRTATTELGPDFRRLRDTLTAVRDRTPLRRRNRRAQDTASSVASALDSQAGVKLPSISSAEATVRELLDRIEDLEAQVDAQTSSKDTLDSATYFCYYLVATLFLLVASSFGLAVYWAIAHNDVSGGFTMGSYIATVATLPVGVVGYRHSHSCQCWVKRDKGLVEVIELRDFNENDGNHEEWKTL